jgi:tetratricopeptide (TPR) repeat protein
VGIAEIHQAIKRFEAHDYAECLKLLQAAEKQHPDLSPARLLFARLCFLKNQPARARPILEEAVAELPDHPEAYVMFGRLALLEGRTTDAALQYEKALALSQAGKWSANKERNLEVAAQAGLADVAERRGHWKEAQTALLALLKIDPNNGPARQSLGRALFHLGQSNQAAQELAHACRDDPTLGAPGSTLGQLWTAAGNLAKAEQAFKAAVADDPRAHLDYANWLLDQNRLEDARSQAEAAIKSNPNSAEVRFLRGMIARALRDYFEAERMFLALHVESPGNFAASNNLALALVELEDNARRQRGLELAQINARLYPNLADALTTLGRAYARTGLLEEAEQTLRSATGTGNATSETLYYLARVIADRGRPGEAKPLVKAALDAPGFFPDRKEAQSWSEQLAKKLDLQTSK